MNKLLSWSARELGAAMARTVTGRKRMRIKKEKLSLERLIWHLFGNVGARALARTRQHR